MYVVRDRHNHRWKAVDCKLINCCSARCQDNLWVPVGEYGPWFCSDECQINYLVENPDVIATLKEGDGVSDVVSYSDYPAVSSIQVRPIDKLQL